MDVSKDKISVFQKKVLGFYGKNRRDLPWRKTTDPYRILVSEMMLQQTQVERVIPFYMSWLQKWPTIRKLAEAGRFDVLRQWSGLGYNKRALYLWETAKKISEKYSGNVLEALEKEKSLPGIGSYTKHAIRIFSANVDEVTVDTNIRRIFIHEFSLKDPSEKEVLEIAIRCLPERKSRDWHNALMDYGAVYLTARKTGIPSMSKQSPFEGSDREVRSQVVKLLLSKGRNSHVTFSELQEKTQIEKFRLRKILSKMSEDGVLFQRRERYALE